MRNKNTEGIVKVKKPKENKVTAPTMTLITTSL